MSASVSVKPISYLLILFSVGLAISGQICLRRGMDRVKMDIEAKTGQSDLGIIDMVKNQPGTLVKEVATSFLVILGLVLFVASAGSWLVVLADVPLGLAYPFVSLTYIVVLLYDWKFESYHISVWNWLGVAAIVAGVVMISLGRMSK